MSREEVVRQCIALGFLVFFVVVWIGYAANALRHGDKRRAVRLAFGAPPLFIGLFLLGFTVAEGIVGDGQWFVEWWVVAIPLAWIGHRLLRGHGQIRGSR